MKRFETVSGLLVAVVVISALSGLAGNALKAVGLNPENVGMADALTGVVTLLIVFAGWLKARLADGKAAEEIRFFLVAGKERRAIPLHLRRRDCSRAETLGRLGMKPLTDPKARFALTGISSAAFLQSLNEVQDGFRSEVMIYCTEAELAQFNWEKME